jgi:hypothetical protein
MVEGTARDCKCSLITPTAKLRPICWLFVISYEPGPAPFSAASPPTALFIFAIITAKALSKSCVENNGRTPCRAPEIMKCLEVLNNGEGSSKRSAKMYFVQYITIGYVD